MKAYNITVTIQHDNSDTAQDHKDYALERIEDALEHAPYNWDIRVDEDIIHETHQPITMNQ